MDTTRATSSGGFFAEGMVIVAEGCMDASRGVFVVDTMGHPPAESREDAFRTIGGKHLDVFVSKPSDRDISSDAPWLIISNCHLDSPATLPRMRSVLAELAMPLCIHYHSMKVKLGAQNFRSKKKPVLLSSFFASFFSP